MKQLSKSRYTAFCQCTKNLWLKVYKPQETTVDDGVQARFEQGNKVGDLAMGLFGEYMEAHAEKPDGSLDLTKMVEQTRQWMDEGVENICEASFICEGGYCAVDILRKTAGGWAIYEVKSTSFPEFNGQKAKLEKYAPDIAYQKWVLTQCGVNVTGTYLVCLNSDYVRQGELDINQLFVINDMKEMVENEYPKVQARVSQAMKVINSEQEPDTELSECCMKPYGCAFWEYCKRQHGVPSPSVFDVYGGKGRGGFTFKKKLDCYHQGLVSFEDLCSIDIGPIQNMQIEAALTGKEFINPAGIRKFLEKITYPIYFLDFETMQDAVPQYDGAKVYAQITFQYSLHIKEKKSTTKVVELENEGRKLKLYETANYIKHKEYLAPSNGIDPRRALAEQLCKDIPKNVCTLAYNNMFECGRIRELAALYPDLAPHLLNIADHIVDLIDPFRAGDYYVPAMGGSFSIKSVLPALFPDEPSLNYHNLDERCQNGGDAMTIFPRIKDMEPVEAAASREALLRYCELDTWAMVKVWEKLKEMAK
ncbi:DUF2779 domain-containing protein [Prevotella sp. P3-122]|uniref:DUF2779 domain-containing protein n=1 Tax=Prevotella sp. P3-122 TaxID=2024223 RepID=UPI000B962D72|nr:DUF2779 domain-containing protein [Prevotella sp. P3-122]OYP58487.1 hypothetical protein CIL02_13910 [Prevotella sp. P3-122]